MSRLLPEDGDRIQSPKPGVLKKEQYKNCNFACGSV
jgi:hypothetical protein